MTELLFWGAYILGVLGYVGIGAKIARAKSRRLWLQACAKFTTLEYRTYSYHTRWTMLMLFWGIILPVVWVVPRLASYVSEPVGDLEAASISYDMYKQAYKELGS